MASDIKMILIGIMRLVQMDEMQAKRLAALPIPG
jgi:hypothetical protein